MEESLNDIFTVIVLYKTTLEDSCTFKTLIDAVKTESGNLHLLLYNNSPAVRLDTSSYKKSNIIFTVIDNVNNSGVSKAYNVAHELAEKNQKKWLLLLDHDTKLPSNFFIEFFFERKLDLKNKDRLYFPIIRSNGNIVSPAHYIPYRGFVRKDIKAGNQNIKKLTIINSGVIIDVDLFKKAGGFNEEVMLDFSDISFFRRLRKYCNTGKLINVTCLHQFSGYENDDYEKIMNRFKIYNTNAIAFGREKGVSKIFLFLTVLSRAINLSLKFKSFNFVRELKFS